MERDIVRVHLTHKAGRASVDIWADRYGTLTSEGHSVTDVPLENARTVANFVSRRVHKIHNQVVSPEGEIYPPEISIFPVRTVYIHGELNQDLLAKAVDAIKKRDPKRDLTPAMEWAKSFS